MTYQDIISQVARRLGHQAFAGQLKDDYRWALKWATAEMAHYIDILKLVTSITLDTTHTEYDLPVNFCHPAQFRFIGSDNNEIQSVEVTLEEFLRWNPNPQIPPTANDFLPQTFSTDITVDNARLGNKIVFCTIFANAEIEGTDPDWKLEMKPTIDGTVEVLYFADPVTDPFTAPNDHPPMPDRYHQYLVYGTIKYLADIEAGQAKSREDWNSVKFFNQLATQYEQKFNEMKEDTRESAQTRTKMPFLKADTWYDNPRKYR